MGETPKAGAAEALKSGHARLHGVLSAAEPPGALPSEGNSSPSRWRLCGGVYVVLSTEAAPGPRTLLF